MRASFFVIVFFFVLGCSTEGSFDGNSDGVVITKNPKGSGSGKAEPKELQLSAPWLNDSTEFLVEVHAIKVLDSAGNSEEVGLLEKGTVLTFTKSKPRKLQFTVDSTAFVNAKSIQVVTGQLYLRSNQKIIGSFSGNQTFTFTPTDRTLSSFEAAFAPAKQKANGVYSISTQLCHIAEQQDRSSSCSDTGYNSDDDEDEHD